MAVRGFPAELAGHWNHNTHYYPLAIAALPVGRALDVGCGDGILLRRLARDAREVVGVDPFPGAGEQPANVTVVHEDFLTAEVPGGFGLVCSFTAIHHMPFEPALRRMAGLVAPGGRLVVVSVAAYTPWSWLLGGLTSVPHRISTRRRGFYQHGSPVARPALTLGQIRGIVRRVLPGAQVRRRLYWRYSIEWTKPELP